MLPPHVARLWALVAFAALGSDACSGKTSDTSNAALPPASLRVTLASSEMSQDIDVDAPPLAALPCSVDDRVDGCCFDPPSEIGFAGYSTPRDFGTIVVSDRSTNTTLLRLPFDPKPKGNATGPASGYRAADTNPGNWTPGDEIGVAVNGTELAVRSPLAIEATTALDDGFLDIGNDLTLRWTPDPHVATMRVEYTAQGYGATGAGAPSGSSSAPIAAHVICDVPDSSGSLTIPAARLGLSTSADGTGPFGEIVFTRVLSAATPMRDSPDTLQLDAQQELYISFQSRKTCSTNADCGDGLGCVCSVCMARGFCDADTDCGAGSYCGNPGPVEGTNPPCTRGTCATVPASITCGSVDCAARIMHFDAKTTLAIAPCCVPVSNACGLDVSPLVITNDTCQPFEQGHGMDDPTCPGCTGDTCFGGALKGCRRADGKCGFDLDDVGLGCVVDPLAP